jgi:hypothetical protein
MANGTYAHIHLLLDANESEAQLMAECPACGAIAIETLIVAWQKRFISCECGVTMEIVPEQLRQLRAMAVEYQRKIDEIIGAN